MNLIEVLFFGAIIISAIDALFILPTATFQYCTECGTRTYRRGILLWSCSNPEHGENCERLDGGDA